MPQPTIGIAPSKSNILDSATINTLNYHIKGNPKKKSSLKPVSDKKIARIKEKAINLLPSELLTPDKSYTETAFSSIQNTISAAHNDIKRFFNKGNVIKYKAEAGCLTLTLDTEINILIFPLCDGKNTYKVINKKKVILLNITV